MMYPPLPAEPKQMVTVWLVRQSGKKNHQYPGANLGATFVLKVKSTRQESTGAVLKASLIVLQMKCSSLLKQVPPQ